MRKLEVGLALDRLLYPFRKRIADAGDRRDVREGRLAHRADAPESAEQGAFLRRTHALDVIEHASHGALGAHLLVVRDRESMRLVAYPLHQIQPLRRPRQHDRVRPRGHEELLALLRQSGYRDLQKTRVRKSRLAGGELRATNMQNLLIVNVPRLNAEPLAKELDDIGLKVGGSPFWRGAIACSNCAV